MRGLLIILFVVVMVTLAAGCSRNHQADDQAFVDRFMGKWLHEEDNERYMLELKKNIELTGIVQSELISRGEITIEEINREEQYIVIHGFTEDLTETSQTKTEHRSKLVLLDNGKTLFYIYDYLHSKVESKWHR